MRVKQQLVDSIYDGIIETPPWQNFLHQLRVDLDAQAIGMWIRSPFLERQKPAIAEFGPDMESLVEPFLEKYHKEAILFRTPMSHGEAKSIFDVVSEKEFQQSAHYEALYDAYHVGDVLRYYVQEPGGLQVWVEMSRSVDLPHFGDAEKKYCQALTPHLTRALGLYSKLNKAEVEADTYAEVVEQLTVGIIILDREGNILKSSGIANDLIEDTSAIDISSGNLRFEHTANRQAYRASFEKIIDAYDRETGTGGVDLITVQQPDGGNLGLLMKSAPLKSWYEGAGCPAVVVYVCDPAAHKNTKESFVAKLFGLTISEASLAILLADGMTLAEAGQKLNIAENTVRTVSKRIFSKTGARRQVELVRLILNSLALIG